MAGAAVYALGMSKTRDHGQMEKRRRQAARLFAKECPPPEVARRLGVARQVAYRGKAFGARAAPRPWPAKVRLGPKTG